MLSWEALDAMPLPAPAPRAAYGPAPQQFGELRLPQVPGPHPVIVLIHGGCWRNRYDLVYITRLAAWLTAQGWATWTIEYRRLGDAGGGWPGTLRDAGAALDHLRRLAPAAGLDLGRVIVAGHSAGGHLALWLASRARLAPSSPLYAADPLPVAGVLGLAAITDLDGFRFGPADSCHGAVEPLMQGGPAEVPQHYADASPLRRLPLGVPQALLQGEEDDTVSADAVRDYAQAAARAGDAVRLWALPDAGHFDVAVAVQASEAALREALTWLRVA
ncbi:hypothetical protein RD110_19840 [Rhodoferax koreense]|uniref:BD-FAE-like domain-containing protein n=1 Tax=Rhodoferax koreensis TaxID=1842727 RepID=A0A1P8JZL8_9BURK|nr:alpha/beta hydrolase [Rhodoferax koreense]APW39189.1 hypothetical protein RD110_19840 [Rhodoferax koreense]